MPEFVYDMPARTLGMWFAIFAVAAMVVGLLIVKPILRILVGSGPDLNQSISYGTSGFNLFYGLLLGLLTVAAYQNNERIKQGLLEEAAALNAIYAAMGSYPEPMSSDMKALLRDYVLFTIHEDWEAHRRGEFLDGGANRANAMRMKIGTFEPQTVGQEAVHAQVLASFEDFLKARQLRLTGILTGIPDVLWYAVLVGATFNILLIVMLRMPIRQHFLLGTISAFFLGVILFVIVALDDPLRGASGLDPEALQLLWDRTMVWDEPIG